MALRAASAVVCLLLALSLIPVGAQPPATPPPDPKRAAENKQIDAAAKRYEDFNASTDKVAAFGLLALIGGVAAKKLGLLALAGVFLVKFAKVIIAACLGGFAVFRKFFRKADNDVDLRNAPATQPAPPPSEPPSIVS